MLTISLELFARLALAVRDLEPPDLTPDTLPRVGASVFLLCPGATLVVVTGVDSIGVGGMCPECDQSHYLLQWCRRI